jgi:hypothetical protein
LVQQQAEAIERAEAERASRLAQGVAAVRAAISADQLDKATRLLAPLARVFTQDQEVQSLADVIRWRERQRLKAPAEDALREVLRRPYRDDPEAAVALLTGVAMDGLPEDLGPSRSWPVVERCAHLVEQRGWSEPHRLASATSRGVVFARPTPQGPYQVVSVLASPDWQPGQTVKALPRGVVEALLEQGRFNEAELAAGAYESAAAVIRDPTCDFYPALWRGALALLRSDTDGFTTQRRALEAQVATGGENAFVLAAVQGLFAAADLGQVDAASNALQALAPTTATMIEPQAAITMAPIGAMRGDRDAAIADGARSADAVRATAQDSEWLPAVVQLAEVAALAGPHALVDWAYQTLRPFAALWAVEGIGAAIRGPVERALGILAARRGDVVTARKHFDGALAACRAAGARMWEERTLRDALLCGQGRRQQEARVAEAALIREGNLWRVEFAGATAHVRDSKGMRDIARLIARPGELVNALDLAGGPGPGVLQAAVGPMLHETAVAAYRGCLNELERLLDRTDRAGDADASAALTSERDALIRELASARGLGGRTRSSGSSLERARTAVTTRIRDALRRLEPAHPSAARHLLRSLRTGIYCAYEPDPPVSWQVSDGA